MGDRQYENLPVVAEGVPTREGKGRLFRMEPGKRVFLSEWDLWDKNDQEPFFEQLKRVFFSPEEIDRRERGAQRLKKSFSRIPYYRKAAEKDGDDYWRRFYASRIHW
jgi:hypothetical protein